MVALMMSSCGKEDQGGEESSNFVGDIFASPFSREEATSWYNSSIMSDDAQSCWQDFEEANFYLGKMEIAVSNENQWLNSQLTTAADDAEYAQFVMDHHRDRVDSAKRTFSSQMMNGVRRISRHCTNVLEEIEKGVGKLGDFPAVNEMANKCAPALHKAIDRSGGKIPHDEREPWKNYSDPVRFYCMQNMVLEAENAGLIPIRESDQQQEELALSPVLEKTSSQNYGGDAEALNDEEIENPASASGHSSNFKREVSEFKDKSRPAAPVRLKTWTNYVMDAYPSRALRDNIEGRVGYSVTLDANGRLTDCTVTSSSGHAELDKAACDAVSKYGKFEPALDAAGNGIPGSWSSSVNYSIAG